MNYSADFSFTYVSGNQSWKVTPSALTLAQQEVVAQALQDGRLDAGDLTTLAELQKACPSAFAKQSYLDNLPPPEDFAVQRFANGWNSMEMSSVMAYINEIMTTLAANQREQASQQQIDEVQHTKDLATQRLTADRNAAADAFTAAVVSAVLAIVSAVVGFLGAVGSGVGTSKHLAEAKDLAEKKAKALCDKFEAQKSFEKFDRKAVKAHETAQRADAAAVQAHPLGSRPSAAIANKLTELRQKDMNAMSPAQQQAHLKEADQLTHALKSRKLAEKAERVEITARRQANREQSKLMEAEKTLSRIDDDVRRLDAKTQELANFTRLISVMAPMFEQFGHIGGAKFTENSKIWESWSTFLSAMIQNADAMDDLFKQNAQSFKELFDSVKDMLQKLLEAQNQTNSSIAARIA